MHLDCFLFSFSVDMFSLIIIKMSLCLWSTCFIF